MTTYAIIMTLIIGILIGIAGTVTVAEWLETRDWNRYRARQARQDSESKQMDEAVALVSDKLGATILSYEN